MTKASQPTISETLYVPSEDRVLDPTLMDQSLKDRMPTPTGWRILVLPYKGKGKTESGIIIPGKTQEEYDIATQVGYVVKLGSLAYKDPKKFGDPTDEMENWKPWCKEGDWVLFARYAGSRLKIDGGEVRILNDDEILGTVMDPDDLIHI